MGNFDGWTLETTDAYYSTWGIATDGQTINYGELYDHNTGEMHAAYSPGLPMTVNATQGEYLGYFVVDGPGYSRMYQDVYIDSAGALASWDMAYTDHNGYLYEGEQNLVVSIRDVDTDEVLRELVNLAEDGYDSRMDMSHFSFDLSEFAGQTVRFNVGMDIQYYYLDTAFDNFQVGSVDVPEPATMTLLALGGATALVRRKKRA